MAEKKTQENPLPETSQSEAIDKPKDVPKPAPKAIPQPTVPIQVPRISIPSFTKTPPNELYRKLLPAILFILTFVTVMTMLLIYMDTFALGAQQFRQNMTQDKELVRIAADSPTFVAYVRQRHLAPRPPRTPPAPQPTPRLAVLDRILGEIYNGTLVELLPLGPRDPTAAYLETVRGWGGARALHACLSPTEHPRVVSYEEPEDGGTVFRSRVLCLPLLTVLVVADAKQADYVAIEGSAAPDALNVLPYGEVRLKVIDFRSTDQSALNRTTEILQKHNYTIAATFKDGIMYSLNGKDTLNGQRVVAVLKLGFLEPKIIKSNWK